MTRGLSVFWLILGLWNVLLAGNRFTAEGATTMFWWNAVTAVLLLATAATYQVTHQRQRLAARYEAQAAASRLAARDPWADLDELLATTHHAAVLETLADDVRTALGFPKSEPAPEPVPQPKAVPTGPAPGAKYSDGGPVTGLVPLVVRGDASTLAKRWVDGREVALPDPAPVPWRERHAWLRLGKQAYSPRVRRFQRGVGVPADGRWGPRTESRFVQLLGQQLVPLQAPRYGATIEVEPGELVRFPGGQILPMPDNTGGLMTVADCKHTGDRVEIATASEQHVRIICSDCGADLKEHAR